MKKRGFTIVEILAGTTLISIGLLSVYLSLVASTSLQRKASFVKTATFEAQKSLESLRNKKFSDLSASNETTTLTSLPYGEKTIAITAPEDNLMKITAVVKWQSGGSNHSITLETLATAGGINDASK